MNNTYYAHTLEGRPVEEWQSLEDHLQKAADRCRQFAEQFNAGAWGELAGRFHDLGKGSREFQAYLRHENGIEDEFSPHYNSRWRRDHATFGARHLYKLSQDAGKLLSYCIAGHHNGLQNWSNGTTDGGLKNRLADKVIKEVFFSFDQQPTISSQLPFQMGEQKLFGFQLQFFIRMLFSCLIDADRLDTERFCNPDKAEKRINELPLQELHSIFWKNFDALRKKAKEKAAHSKVNVIREKVLADCLAAAQRQPGLFTLTVPTGGGKTLASLAFALEHAQQHKQFRRIIYVIPFTSIIEQNARVFRDMLGNEAVLEHHSNFTPDKDDWKSELAAENWDAPVVVTTNVQFFDSFFACKTSPCRKLHNVAGSIIIFDEVQAIPVERLQPCLEVLRELTRNYGVTAVLCTATQPAIGKSDEFKAGLALEQAEIIRDVPKLFKELQRTRMTWLGKQTQEEIAAKLRQEEQVLCVVSTRDQAATLFEQIKEEKEDGIFHLSALMYPLHRSRVLQEIRERLRLRQPCRVISTQLIEAGVDVDFPVVYRSLAGMDSIAQAAGRCNREGLLAIGEIFVYEPEKNSNLSYFRQTADSAKRLFGRFADKFLEPECIQEYFADYFWKNQQRIEENDILKLCQAGAQKGDFAFEEIAAFKMIDTANKAIVIALEDEALKLVSQLEYAEYSRSILRKLQHYTVQVYPNQFNELKCWLEEAYKGVFVLKSSEMYSQETGLKCKSPEGQGYVV
ncbi:MAG: CRISPR-associated helicase, Cas3 family [Candidatus Electronema aureum]|uniref:CRISPR-associated helicase, Cas3 family n=1 Tax=Candidatus Electronema aureum TaxID=2005002 RepID=A0A521G305_9BACT|nr:MAG: CRISPR-associated helicase, Cas3 family [Candidatus Electronema aureum]